MSLESWNVSLKTIAAVLGAPVEGDSDLVLQRVSTDSRDILPGDFFVALKGARSDGHDFIADVRAQGAKAALVEKPVDGLPYVLVDSCVEALATLAQWWREQCKTPMIAITGSNGKTSVKELTAHILRAYVTSQGGEGVREVLSTEGNFNNHLGLPLTLLRLRPAHRYAVVEMGMNHAGELSKLTRIARPNVALVNNVQRAHVGMFESIEGVAHAKAEIFEGLTDEGVAIINADDAFADLAQQKAGQHKVLKFSTKIAADVGPVVAHIPVNQALPPAQQLVIQIGASQTACHLPLMGEHSRANALAAITAAMALGVSAAFACRALEDFPGVPGRLQVIRGASGARIIDDTYNANPDSVLAAISVLASQTGRRVLILGDLGELGEGALDLHREVGQAAREAHLEDLFGLGVSAREAVKAFGDPARSTEDFTELCSWVRPLLKQDVTVLVKGSRFMKMERVVKELVECC